MSMSSRLGFGVVSICAVVSLAVSLPRAQAQLPSVVTYGQRWALPLPSGVNTLSKLSRDAQGNIYSLDKAVPRVVEIPVNGPSQVVVPSTDASVSAIANNLTMTVDSAGNIYIIKTSNSSPAITEIPRNANGTYNYAGETTPAAGLSALTGGYFQSTDAAVDSLGNIYIASGSGSTVGTWTGVGILMIGPSAPSGKYIIGGTGAPAHAPNSIAVDAAGNLFYADGTNAYEITAASVAGATNTSQATPVQIGYNGTGTCPSCTTLPATIKTLFVDPSGNVYLASTSASAWYVVVNNGSPFSTTSATYVLPGSVTGHSSYDFGTVDGQGNLITHFSGSVELYGSTYNLANSSSGPAALSNSTATTAYFLFTQPTTLMSGTAGAEFALSFNGAAYGGPGLYTSANGTSVSTTTGCTAGGTYGPGTSLGTSCSVGLTVKSVLPGPYSVTVSLLGSSGQILASYTQYSQISGAAVTIDTGAKATVGAGYVAPAGVAVDNTGAMYVADPDSNAVYKYAAGSTTTGTAVGTGLSVPSGVALDSAGNVYIADTGNDRVVYLSNGTQAVLSTPGYTLSGPRGVAVDGFGAVYIADTGNGRILKVPNPFSGTPAATIEVLGFSGLSTPFAIAFDAFDDIFVADKGANAVYELGGYATTGANAAFTSPTSQVTVGTALTAPTGVAVDASGSVYIADGGNSRVVKVPSVVGALANGSQVTLYSGLNKPFGIATDATGDIYFTDQTAPGAYFVQRSAASGGTAATIPFGSVATNGTASQSAIVTNDGLLTALTLSAIAEPSTPFGGTSSCGTLPVTLTAGSGCTLSLSFNPASAGTATPGTLTLTDTALAASAATQAATLTGAASGPIASVSLTGPATAVYGDGATFTVTAKDSSGNGAVGSNGTYTVSITGTATSSATVTLSGGTGSFFLPSVGVGTYNLSVTIGSFTGTASITLSKAPLYLIANSVARLFDVANPVLATSYSGFVNGDTSSVVSGTAPTVATTATRVSAAADYPITLTGGTPTATNYTIDLIPGILQVNGSVPQSIFFPPLPNFTHGVTVTLTGVSSSGLPLTYTVSGGTISGNTLTVGAVGTVTVVTATQAGNGTYAAAAAVTRSFTAQ